MKSYKTSSSLAHNPKVTGSSPVPATIEKPFNTEGLFCYL